MKQRVFLMLIIVLFSFCKNKTAPTNVKTDSTTTPLTYPYTPKHPTKWQTGDEKYALIVLNFLKKSMEGDVKGELVNFADSVEFKADKFYFKGAKAGLYKKLARIKRHRHKHNIHGEFEKWMTAYYPENKDSKVTVWYLERWEHANGQKDSLYHTDDVTLKKGQIYIFDEKIRHFPDPTE